MKIPTDLLHKIKTAERESFILQEQNIGVSLRSKRGFTLIELLVVISIIGILSSVVLSSLSTSREKAKIGKVKAELSNIKTAISLLASDTGKWPNGCPINPTVNSNPEVALDTAQAGIKERPSACSGTCNDTCAWQQSEVDNWNGPYMKTPTDPWGNSYYFDPDYSPYQNWTSNNSSSAQNNCSNPPGSKISVVNSYGPNGGTLNRYDCDDIFLEIR